MNSKTSKEGYMGRFEGKDGRKEGKKSSVRFTYCSLRVKGIGNLLLSASLLSPQPSQQRTIYPLCVQNINFVGAPGPRQASNEDKAGVTRRLPCLTLGFMQLQGFGREPLVLMKPGPREGTRPAEALSGCSGPESSQYPP